MTKNEIKKQMDAVPLFHGISIDEMHCVYRRIRKNLIANEVDSGREHVGIILSGSMDVYSVLPDDTEVRLSKLHAGDLFGICNLFSSYDRETILKCRSDCDVAFVPKDSKEIWAKSLGISRAALYRELADLREKGIIRIKGRQITLLKREILENTVCGTNTTLSADSVSGQD